MQNEGLLVRLRWEQEALAQTDMILAGETEIRSAAG